MLTSDDRYADLEARIAEILYTIRRGEATDTVALIRELEELRRQQRALEDAATQGGQLSAR